MKKRNLGKKMLAQVLTVSMIGSVSFCATTVMAGEADDDITVAAVVYMDDQFQNLITKGYEDAAKDAGVKILTDNTNNDQSKETELINTYMTQGVDGLAISPLNGDASLATLKEAADGGMKIALADYTIDESKIDFSVGGFTSDGYTNGHLAGAEAAEIIKEKHGDEEVKIGIVQFASLLPDQSKNRVDGYLAALDEAGVKYEVVANQDAWMQDTAIETAGAIITANPDLDVILAMNDGGTIGSTMAVVNAGLEDQIMVFGHDGSDQISSMVLDDNSPLQSVVSQDPYTMGYQAVTTLVKAIKGEEIESEGKTTFIEGIVLSSRDKDAVNAWRVEQGFEEIK